MNNKYLCAIFRTTVFKAAITGFMFSGSFTSSCTKPELTEPVMPPEPKEYQLPVDSPQGVGLGEPGSEAPIPNDIPETPKEDLLEDVPEAPPVMEEATKEDGLKPKERHSKKAKSKNQKTKKTTK